MFVGRETELAALDEAFVDRAEAVDGRHVLLQRLAGRCGRGGVG